MMIEMRLMKNAKTEMYNEYLSYFCNMFFFIKTYNRHHFNNTIWNDEMWSRKSNTNQYVQISECEDIH